MIYKYCLSITVDGLRIATILENIHVDIGEQCEFYNHITNTTDILDATRLSDIIQPEGGVPPCVAGTFKCNNDLINISKAYDSKQVKPKNVCFR